MSRIRKQKEKSDECLYLGHDWEEFIDPNSGGFICCKNCGESRDCEDPDGDLG